MTTTVNDKSFTDSLALLYLRRANFYNETDRLRSLISKEHGFFSNNLKHRRELVSDERTINQLNKEISAKKSSYTPIYTPGVTIINNQIDAKLSSHSKFSVSTLNKIDSEIASLKYKIQVKKRAITLIPTQSRGFRSTSLLDERKNALTAELGQLNNALSSMQNDRNLVKSKISQNNPIIGTGGGIINQSNNLLRMLMALLQMMMSGGFQQRRPQFPQFPQF